MSKKPRKNKKKNKNERIEIYFVNGRMKKRRIPLIGGLEREEFIRRNADDLYLLQEGHYDILYEREQARAEALPRPPQAPGQRPDAEVGPECPF